MTTDMILVRRRQRVELASIAGRGTGLLATLAYAISWARHPGNESLLIGALVAAVLMLLGLAASVVGYRRVQQPSYSRLRAAQTTLDGAVITGAVLTFHSGDEARAWPLLVIPILLASQQGRTGGAALSWALTTGCYAGGGRLLDGRFPADLPMAVTILLIVAVAAGTQGAAFGRQLEELQAARSALSHQASHDSLTGLANRSCLAEHAAARHNDSLAVLLLDLNHFKQVNDTLGHAAGDELLRVVARRLVDCIRADDIAGRLGGDEFVILLFGGDAETATTVSGRIRAALAEPVDLGGVRLPVHASIGVALRPDGADTDLEMLTARADVAMYAEKTAHRSAGASSTTVDDRAAARTIT